MLSLSVLFIICQLILNDVKQEVKGLRKNQDLAEIPMLQQQHIHFMEGVGNFIFSLSNWWAKILIQTRNTKFFLYALLTCLTAKSIFCFNIFTC